MRTRECDRKRWLQADGGDSQLRADARQRRGAGNNPWAWLGGAGSLLLLGSYLYAIRSMPLGVAYPIATSLGTVAVALAGVLIFSESLRPSNIIGIALVVTGVLLISR